MPVPDLRPYPTSDYQRPNFSRVIPLLNQSGISSLPQMVPIFRINTNLTILAIYGWRADGTGFTLNVRRTKIVGGAIVNLLSADLSVTQALLWTPAPSTILQNNFCVPGDSLEALFQSVSGSATLVAIQIEGTAA